MSEKRADVWTSRDVEFSVYPYDEEGFERLFGTLPEHYWDTWRHRVFGTLLIASCGLTVTVGAWPWWVPKALAVRSVTAFATRQNVGGEARFVIDRIVLTDTPTPGDPR